MQNRQHHVARGAGVGRALQDDELARPQRGGDLLGRLLDVGQVRVAAVVQRRRHADQQGVRLAQPPHVGGGHELAVGHVLGDPLGRNVLDVAAAGLELIDLGPINVEAHRLHTAGDEGADQRQADIAQADDAHLGSLVLNCLFERGSGHGTRIIICRTREDNRRVRHRLRRRIGSWTRCSHSADCSGHPTLLKLLTACPGGLSASIHRPRPSLLQEFTGDLHQRGI